MACCSTRCSVGLQRRRRSPWHSGILVLPLFCLHRQVHWPHPRHARFATGTDGPDPRAQVQQLSRLYKPRTPNVHHANIKVALRAQPRVPIRALASRFGPCRLTSLRCVVPRADCHVSTVPVAPWSPHYRGPKLPLHPRTTLEPFFVPAQSSRTVSIISRRTSCLRVPVNLCPINL